MPKKEPIIYETIEKMEKPYIPEPEYRDTQHKIRTEVIHKNIEYSNQEVVIKYVDEPYEVYDYKPNYIKHVVKKYVARPVPYIVKRVCVNNVIHEVKKYQEVPETITECKVRIIDKPIVKEVCQTKLSIKTRTEKKPIVHHLVKVQDKICPIDVQNHLVKVIDDNETIKVACHTVVPIKKKVPVPIKQHELDIVPDIEHVPFNDEYIREDFCDYPVDTVKIHKCSEPCPVDVYHTKIKVEEDIRHVDIKNVEVCFVEQHIPIKKVIVTKHDKKVDIYNEKLDIHTKQECVDLCNHSIKIKEVVHNKEVETEKLRVVKKIKKVSVEQDCLKTRQFVNTWNTLFQLKNMGVQDGNSELTDEKFIEHVRSGVRNNAQAVINTQ